MALNATSHNMPSKKTGSTVAAPPETADLVPKDLLDTAKLDVTGQSAPSKDGSDSNAGTKVKSDKELEKERKKAEKDAKFQAKKKAKAQAAPSAAKEGEEMKDRKKKDEGVLLAYIEETAKGDKKILKSLDDPYHKAYIPAVVESAWYDWWEKEGFFKPEFTPDGEPKAKGTFVVPIPPPNVTGKLHCGHALATSLQDLLVRWHRMQGYTTLYLPGCDHAAIATQAVVENMLWRREKKTRHDLGRPTFLETTVAWVDEYKSNINGVLKRLGGSFDWTREAFTMDANLSAAVTEVFVRMHDDGLIYRDNRIVNWCTKLSTALSTLEVDNKELTGRTLLDIPGYDRKIEFGTLTHFKYPIAGTTDEYIQIASTRPETMLGDTGIAVHPSDERYKHLLGKHAKHPFLDRLLPIIADNHVDKDYGTGAVKITPAHDPDDFAIGKRHSLAFINILNDDGTMNHNAGKFQGHKRFDVRFLVIQELTDLGLFVKTEENPMSVPLCSRSKDVIEPIMKPQWYMKMKGLAEPAIRAVREGDIKIIPATSRKLYYHWMENVNDWCLSRQLWFGHQCPAYFVHLEGETTDRAETDRWVAGRTEEEAHKKAEAKFPGKVVRLERDPDVLDTWFSSGLWPFSTLGWPKDTHDMQKLFPTSVLETGWDTLFFWVARMIFFSLYLTGKVPFKEVYCHSLIRDSEGRKMSKSLGNVVDPIDIIEGISLQALHEKLRVGNLDPKEVKTAERYQKTAFPQGIPECGADALRMALIGYTTGGGDIAFDTKVIHSYRRFCNKMYQATKYILGRLGDFTPRSAIAKSGRESLAERWILHKLTLSAKLINERLTQREFSNSTQIAHKYFLEYLCDTFIENSKVIFDKGTEEQKDSAKQTLYTAIEGGLTMIHPFMPFLTEELWQRLPRREGDKTPSIMVATYPEWNEAFDDSDAEAEYELLVNVSKSIRSLTAEYKLQASAHAYIQALDDKTHKVLTTSTSLPSIHSLVGKAMCEVFDLTILSTSESSPTGCAVHTVGSVATVFLDIKGHVDIDAEISRAMAKLQKATEVINNQRKIMAVPDYRDKVSDAVKEGDKEKLLAAETESRNLRRSIEQFEQLKL